MKSIFSCDGQKYHQRVVLDIFEPLITISIKLTLEIFSQVKVKYICYPLCCYHYKREKIYS